MSELRDRIAEAACGATSAGKLFPWDTLSAAHRESWYSVADAVIEALGLKRASRPSDYGYVNYPPGYQYVTEWIADD